ncbi:hypothetical protein BJY16_001446 [Actinoplanes octamycinicus]|uniref:Uncharacterized protein n=1 Tax=Actinoplanes octamycinicus TaxID=135948 RepID=A0A7W7M5N9_9ACTN|nr:hypothetical protein [Actinoplanes octamycinicus]MBB4737987.1 hypothetical protein [Actinoplanes octamycinicus]GIE58963.1 hypothetical protein Aoc01nite_43650 [Actinoplanes octamycinicus]
MTNRYRITDASGPTSNLAGARRLRPALWLLLIISLAVNAASSTIGATVVSLIFGLITLACAAGLAVDHYRRRDR